MKKNNEPKPGTLSVWAGENGPHWQRSTQVPVVHSVSFGYDDVDEWLKVGMVRNQANFTLRLHPICWRPCGAKASQSLCDVC